MKQSNYIDFFVVAIGATTGELIRFYAEIYYDRSTWSSRISPHINVFQGTFSECDKFIQENKESDLEKLPTFTFSQGKFAFNSRSGLGSTTNFGKNGKYVVFEGKQPGIYDNWTECERQVKGVKGAKYKRYDSEAQAREAFASYVPVRYKQRPIMGIASDASFITTTNVLRFRVVNIETLQEVYSNVFENCRYATNLGEFLGLVQAIKYVLENNLACAVYSDSATAIAWVTKQEVKSCLDAENKMLAPLVEEGLEYLKSLPALPTIEKWETNIWGEIPADYGNKSRKDTQITLYGCMVGVASIEQGQRRYDEASFVKMLCISNGLPVLGMSLNVIAESLPDLQILHRQSLKRKLYLTYLHYRGAEYVLQSNNKSPEIL